MQTTHIAKGNIRVVTYVSLNFSDSGNTAHPSLQTCAGPAPLHAEAPRNRQRQPLPAAHSQSLCQQRRREQAEGWLDGEASRETKQYYRRAGEG